MALMERLKNHRLFRIILMACLAAFILVRLGMPALTYIRKSARYPAGSLSGSLPVLCYHCIREAPSGSDYSYLYVEPGEFSRQIAWLKGEGYRFLTPEEAWVWQQSADRGETVDKAVLITFDDGYSDNYTNALPILKEQSAKASLFMVAGKIGENNRLTEGELREMAASGVFTLGSHGYWHQDLTASNDQELADQLLLSREALSALAAEPVTSIAYPLGACDARVAEIAGRYFDFGYLASPEKPPGPDKAKASDTRNSLVIPRQGIFGYMDMAEFRLILGQYFAY